MEYPFTNSLLRVLFLEQTKIIYKKAWCYQNPTNSREKRKKEKEKKKSYIF